MNVKVVLQDGIKDCGICCLLSVIRYYGGEVSKEYLREITNTSKEGVSLYQLLEGATKVGFEAIGVSGDLLKIENNNLPCLAHIIVNKNYQHFVVIYKIDKEKKQVLIMDPAKGKKTLSIAEFKLLSSKNFLFLKPSKKLPVIKRKQIITKTLLFVLKEHKYFLFLFFILTLLNFLFNCLSLFHFKYLLELAVAYKITENIYFISITLLIIYIFRELLTSFRTILLNKFLTIFDYETTYKTFKQVLLLPYLYYKNRTTGEVLTRFRDLATIKNFLAKAISCLTSDTISILIFIFFMIKYQDKLTLIILGFVIILGIVIKINLRKKRKLIRKLEKNEDRLNSYLIEAISNVDTIKGSHLEKRLSDRFSYKYKDMLDVIYKYSINIVKNDFINKIFNNIEIVIIYGIGSYLVIKEKMSLGEIIIYQTFFNYFMISINNIFELVNNYSDLQVAKERIEDLFLIQQEEFKNNFYYLGYQLEGDICIKNLNYKIGSRYLFKNVNLSIKKGEKILVSGASGSGKSTLVKILMRYIEVGYGIVKIAGIDINHYHLENIRKNITYVSSNEYLFTDTLKNNIVLYKEISEEEFSKVVKICLVDEIVKDNNYNKIVEENGFNFSSGEKQRIVLARSLLRKSNIYIFDEALGQIDINKEKKILMNIFKYLEGKIIIVISHRFNNKKLFDRVIKLEDGEIYEN